MGWLCFEYTNDEVQHGSGENWIGVLRREAGNQVVCVFQKVGAECGADDRVGNWEDKGCRSWEQGILMGKKKKQRERREGKACTITETTMRFSRWCCWWVSATS